MLARRRLAIPLIVDLHRQRTSRSTQADALPNHLAVTGVAPAIHRSPAVRLHAAAARHHRRHDARPALDAPKQLARWLPPTSSTTAGSPASPRYSIAKGVALPFVPQRGGALGRARDGVPDLDVRTVADRRRVPPRLRGGQANTLVDIWRCYELWSLVGELRDVPGAILEVGVWRGGTGALMATRAGALGIDEPVFLCDTWAGRRQDRRRRHVLPRRQARRRVAGRTVAGPGRPRSGSTTSSCLQGVFPDDTADRIADTPSGSATRRRRLPLREGRASTGCGRGSRPAESSSSTTTASRRVPASPSSSTSSALLDDRTRPAQPERPWSRRQALTDGSAPARSASTGGRRPVDRFGVWLSGVAVRRTSRPSPATARRLRLRLRRQLRPHRSSTRSRRPRSSTSRCADDLKAGRRVTGDRGAASRGAADDRDRTRSTSRSASRCSSTSGIRSTPSRAATGDRARRRRAAQRADRGAASAPSSSPPSGSG